MLFSPGFLGFGHSAFTFAHESLVARSVVADADVPPGALVTFIQKGLQYVEIESHLQEVIVLREILWGAVRTTRRHRDALIAGRN